MLPIVCGSSVFVLLCTTLCQFLVLKRKRKLVALLLLSYRCIVTITVLCLFLTVPWVGLQFVIVVFPNHTHLLFWKHNEYYVAVCTAVYNPNHGLYPCHFFIFLVKVFSSV